MASFWFTADTHFGHEHIIEACKRPFSSIEEHDECLIKRWNDRVKPGDHVIHVGDFAMGPIEKIEKVFRRLNGRKVLVVGNHDRTSRRLRWAEVHDGIREMTVEGKHIVLCHYPMRSWPRAYHGSTHLFGHTHGRIPGTSQSCDVGVDVWDYRPVALGEIRDAMALSDRAPEERATATARGEA